MKSRHLAAWLLLFLTFPLSWWAEATRTDAGTGPETAVGSLPGLVALVALWPSAVALASVLLTRKVLGGLAGGALAGSILLAGGDPVSGFFALIQVHFLPLFGSSWKTGALIFTLTLGGFVALIEKGGGLNALIRRIAGGGGDPRRRTQLAGFGLGMVCFFDGLANSMMVGRIMLPLARRVGVSRVKLAYLVDSTSSSVACVAFVSTWIAYQLAMIQEGFAVAGLEGEARPYSLFFQSIPYNFYAWFTLALLLVVILRSWDIGPMKRFEAEAWQAVCGKHPERPEAAPLAASPHLEPGRSEPGLWRALVPVAVLIAALLGGLYADGIRALNAERAVEREAIRTAVTDLESLYREMPQHPDLIAGAERSGISIPGYIEERRQSAETRIAEAHQPLRAWPVDLRKLSQAFSSADAAFVLVWTSLVASAVAFLLFPRRWWRERGHCAMETTGPGAAVGGQPEATGSSPIPTAGDLFLGGVLTLFGPILILISAWMLGSTLEALHASEVLAVVLEGKLPLWLLPAVTFLTGAAISFSTGTAWGTMGILMPLALPVALRLAGAEPEALPTALLAGVVAAVFSGAVFGDHCSPISDTTIVSSIACGVEPHDHVRTQLPYALIAALVALLLGFLPAGLGLTPWVSLLLGVAALLALTLGLRKTRNRGADTAGPARS